MTSAALSGATNRPICLFVGSARWTRAWSSQRDDPTIEE